MWALITERYLYFGFGTLRLLQTSIISGVPVRRAQLGLLVPLDQISSLNRQSATSTLGLIKALVALCPLLGLLGTVTGMIEVFDVMAISGSGNARAMAAGVSQATVSTMAGMVSALSGLTFPRDFSVVPKRKCEIRRWTR